MPFGWDDLLGIPTGGAYNLIKHSANGDIGDVAKGAGGVAGDAGDMLFGTDPNKAVDLTNFTAHPYQFDPNAYQFGGHPGGADYYTNKFFGLGDKYAGMANQNFDDMAFAAQGRTPAQENADLVNRFNMAGADTQGSVDLARQAAMGQAPSQAEQLMKSGMEDAIAGQQSAAGSARGGAALALAQGNAAANTANIQNNVNAQMGALRANEMAQARGLYGSLAGQNQQMQYNRLGQGNQMAQFNAGLNDQMAQGLLNAGTGRMGQAGNLAQGYYGMGLGVQNQQLAANQAQQAAQAGEQGRADQVNLQTNLYNTNAEKSRLDKIAGAGQSLLGMGVNAAGGGGGGGGGMMGSAPKTGGAPDPGY